MHNEPSSNTSLTHFLCQPPPPPPPPQSNKKRHPKASPAEHSTSNDRKQISCKGWRGAGTGRGGRRRVMNVCGAHVHVVDRRQNVNKLLKNCQTDQLNGNNKNHTRECNASVAVPSQWPTAAHPVKHLQEIYIFW